VDAEVIESEIKKLLRKFVAESNRIEGIVRSPWKSELEVTRAFIDLAVIRVADLENFVNVCAGAPLRINPGMNVTVGDHLPPLGGPAIGYKLEEIVKRVNDGADPHEIHVAYETLHPFMDGNGRSGRVLWAWQMCQKYGREGLQLGFLHRWYYQSLSAARRWEK
jgi:Fic/DOC family protein